MEIDWFPKKINQSIKVK